MSDPNKTIDSKLDDAEDVANYFDKLVTNIKLIVVISIIFLYALDFAGYLKDWNSSCYNDLALHNYKCTLATQKCFDRLKTTSNIFYCTAADLLAKNNNFCNSGVCDKSDKYCEDNGFTDRVETYNTQFRDCMYKENPNHKVRSCEIALGSDDSDYGNCDMNVEIF